MKRFFASFWSQKEDLPSWWLWRRLAWRQAAALLLAIALAAGTVAWRTVATIRSLDDAALQSQASLVASHLSAGPNGAPVLRMPPALAAAFARSDGGSLYMVFDRGRAALASQPAAEALLAPYLPAREGLFRVPPSEDDPAGLLGAVVGAGHGWRVVVAQAQEQQEALLASLLRDFLVSTLLFLLPIGGLTVLVGILTTRNGLRPLREASAAAARIGPREPGMRLPEAGLPGEMAPLVGAMNGALARLERALDAQRRFVAEAAHALRTPLAVLTARIDAMPADTTAIAATLAADADRITRLVSQMLTMARLEELPLDVGATVDLAAVAVEAISARALLAIRAGVELALIRPDAPAITHGNHDALVLALGNLIDNALAHAPRGSIVEVVATQGELRVEDRGAGVPAAEREAIFTRFGRGSGARPGGAGLGLAIVGRIAAAHGGSARAEPREGGGAIFILSLG